MGWALHASFTSAGPTPEFSSPPCKSGRLVEHGSDHSGGRDSHDHEPRRHLPGDERDETRRRDHEIRRAGDGAGEHGIVERPRQDPDDCRVGSPERRLSGRNQAQRVPFDHLMYCSVRPTATLVLERAHGRAGGHPLTASATPEDHAPRVGPLPCVSGDCFNARGHAAFTLVGAWVNAKL